MAGDLLTGISDDPEELRRRLALANAAQGDAGGLHAPPPDRMPLAAAAPAPASPGIAPARDTSTLGITPTTPDVRMPPLRMERPSLGFSAGENRISQNHPFWGGLLKGMDVAGSVVAPGVMSNIPGTMLHEQKKMAAGNQVAKGNAGLEKEQAETERTQAQTEALKNPPPKQGLTPEETTIHDLMTGENGQPRLNPDTQNPYTYLEAYEAIKKAGLEGKPEKAAHITYDSGIPVSVTDAKGKTYDINDPKLPPDLKPLVDSANRAHKQHITEQNQSEDKRTAASDARQAKTFAQQEKMFQEHQEALTSTTKSMIETVPKVQALSKRIRPLITELQGSLGPTAGRWSEFWAGKVGTADPKFTKLRTDVGLLQTALMRMHVGARGGEQMMEHFKGLIDSGKQSPENLAAALDAIDEYAQDVAAEKPGAKKEGAAGGTEQVTEYVRDPATKKLVPKTK